MLHAGDLYGRPGAPVNFPVARARPRRYDVSGRNLRIGQAINIRAMASAKSPGTMRGSDFRERASSSSRSRDLRSERASYSRRSFYRSGESAGSWLRAAVSPSTKATEAPP